MKRCALTVLVLIGLGYFFPRFSNACQLSESFRKSGHIFLHKNGKIRTTYLSELSIINCSQDLLISRSVDRPSPQNFSTESWLANKSNPQRSCRLEFNGSASPVPGESFFDQSPLIPDLVTTSQNCLGMRIQDTEKKSFDVIKSKNCHVVTAVSPYEILVRGDNCHVSSKSVLNLKIDTVVFSECSVTGTFVDIDLRYRVASLPRSLASGRSPEILGEKKFELVFENPNANSTRYRMSNNSYGPMKSSDYNFDFQFMDLRLTGSKYSQVKVSSVFLVQNKGYQKIPFVLKHDLYLKKAKNPGLLLLRTWMSGAQLPGQWMGVDGLSETFNLGPSFDSFALNENIKKAQPGDYLVLQTVMVSPNSGHSIFTNYFKEILSQYRKSQKSQTPDGKTQSEVIDVIEPLKSLGTIRPIAEFNATGVAANLEDAFRVSHQKSVHYLRLCQNNQCVELDQMDRLPESRVLFLIQESEIEMIAKPIEWQKSVNGQWSSVSPHLDKKIVCN